MAAVSGGGFAAGVAVAAKVCLHLQPQTHCTCTTMLHPQFQPAQVGAGTSWQVIIFEGIIFVFLSRLVISWSIFS